MAEHLARLEDCLARLPGHLAEMLRRHYQQGQTSQEIAEDMGRSPVAVRVSMMRTRTQLLKCILDEGTT